MLERLCSRDELTTDAATLAALHPRLQRLVAALESREAELVLDTSPGAYRRVLLQARVLVQHAHVYRGGDFDVAARNRFMAENVLALLSGTPPGVRAVLWAHNDHVAKTPAETGIYLEDAFGDGYYALGLMFGQGAFQARDATETGLGSVRRVSVGVPPEGKHDWLLARPELGSYVVNLRRGSADPRVRGWLGSFQPLRLAGCVVSERGRQRWSEPSAFSSVQLDRAFDGLVFVPITTPSRSNLPLRLGGTPCYCLPAF